MWKRNAVYYMSYYNGEGATSTLLGYNRLLLVFYSVLLEVLKNCSGILGIIYALFYVFVISMTSSFSSIFTRSLVVYNFL